MTRNLSSSVLQKFSGYEIIRNEILGKEKLDFNSINIVYGPSFDENESVVCNFTDQIHTAYRSYIGRFDKGKQRVSNRIVRNAIIVNFFAKNEGEMKKHLTICAAKEGITYSFENGQIIDYQDNFKYMGDVLFCVYFNIETTASDSLFFLFKNVFH